MKAFVIAMPNEAKCLEDNLSEKKEEFLFGRRVVRGKLNDEEVLLVVSGVGKVNAAAAAQFAIQAGADTIYNIGVAGGLEDTMKIGDIFSIDRAVEYDFDLSQLNGTQKGTLNEYSSPYIELEEIPSVEPKTLGTGDRFNDDDDDNDLLTKELACSLRDMEGAAVAHVCKTAGVKCILFKCVSDVRGMGSAPGQYVTNLVKCLKKLTQEIPALVKAT